MNINPQKKTSEQMVEAIFALDLEPIKTKLMEKTEGQGWTRAQVDHYELEYKRFLALLARFPSETIAPNKEVDKFWHGHILDTMKYAEDCDKVFGFFLHHYPYFGMRGEEDAANLAKAFVNMQRLHRQEFSSGAEPANTQQAAWCGAAVKAESAAWCGATVGNKVELAESQVAWCGATVDPSAKAAWCGATVDPSAKAAWCGAAIDPSAKAAWCGATVDPSAKAAWCGAAIDPSAKAAWCGATVDPSAKAAWCGATVDPSAKAAWCGATVDPSAKAAWCGAVAGSHVETAEQKAAWCGAVQTQM